MTYERACSICHKRIGSSAFVAYPQGTLAHYSCYKRSAEPVSSSSQGASAGMAPVFDILQV